MTPQFTYQKAQEFGISFAEARMHRMTYLKSAIEDFKTRINTAVKLFWSETQEVGQELLLERVLIPHWSKLLSFQTELDQFNNFKAKTVGDVIDWQKASEYPCTDLLGQPAKKMGQEWLYHAPNREDRKPSFSVSITKNIWHDWATGQGGNVLDLYILLNGGNKVNAAKSLLNI